MSGIVQSSCHLPAGSVNTLVLTHIFLCTAHLWGTELPPLPQFHTLLLLWGFQQISPVVEADPTLVAVRGAIGAADWLQVPWAGHPEGPILADAAGILAAINLGKQHNIGPKVRSCPERTSHTASHLPQRCPQLQPGGNPEVSF